MLGIRMDSSLLEVTGHQYDPGKMAEQIGGQDQGIEKLRIQEIRRIIHVDAEIHQKL